MTPDQLREIMAYLRDRVRLDAQGADAPAAIRFDAPSTEEMIAAGLDAEGCRQILTAPWWEEMIADIVETPEMCDPDDPPEQVLAYAQDVVSEYIRKRAQL